MPGYWSCLLPALIAVSGCASSPQPKQSETVPLSTKVSVSVLRGDSRYGGQLRVLRPGDVLQADEPLTLDVTVDRVAYVAVVMHSYNGESEDLNVGRDAAAPMSIGVPRRFVIPRRAPPGVKETELRVFVVASSEPLSGAARGLLRLPCGVPLPGGRGDRVGEEKKEKPKTDEQKKDDGQSRSGSTSSNNGRPAEGERKGPGEPHPCSASPGLSAPLTVVPIVVSSS